jgi:hypothetical protein
VTSNVEVRARSENDLVTGSRRAYFEDLVEENAGWMSGFRWIVSTTM